MVQVFTIVWNELISHPVNDSSICIFFYIHILNTVASIYINVFKNNNQCIKNV